jgi:hypothetical protein
MRVGGEFCKQSTARYNFVSYFFLKFKKVLDFFSYLSIIIVHVCKVPARAPYTRTRRRRKKQDQLFCKIINDNTPPVKLLLMTHHLCRVRQYIICQKYRGVYMLYTFTSRTVGSAPHVSLHTFLVCAHIIVTYIRVYTQHTLPVEIYRVT